MKKYLVRGGRRLCGEVKIQGSKNSAVAILMACIAVRGTVILHRVPYITDVYNCLALLEYLGARVREIGEGVFEIDSRFVKKRDLPLSYISGMRASCYVMGAFLNRFGECESVCCGGCELGGRPLDFHYRAFEQLGADWVANGGCSGLRLERDLNRCCVVEFPGVTVGGTVNALLACSCRVGAVTVKNAAREPHVCDLVRFLNKCGANIRGVGGSVLCVTGVEGLHGCEFELSGDMIEAGTFLIGGALTGGSVRVSGVASSELLPLCDVFSKLGCYTECGSDWISVSGMPEGCATVKTSPYPGFPTDLHPQIAVLLSVGKGESCIKENVFAGGRFAYVDELVKMGVKAEIFGNEVLLCGGTRLHSADVSAMDLRGGAALLLAALAADGESLIGGVEYIERGYSLLLTKLRALGADIQEVNTD